MRTGDTVARLGGDEFAILLEDADLADARAGRDRAAGRDLREPIDRRRARVVTFGPASAWRPGVPGRARAAKRLLRNADVAMYLAKDRGKGTIAVYEPQLHAEALDRLALRADLQRAIRSDELVLHYQPTVDLGRRRDRRASRRWCAGTTRCAG